MQAGYRVSAFEISRPRARYAHEKLGIDLVADVSEDALSPEFYGSYDCFFSAHVLEHVPVPNRVLSLARSMLRSGGLFVAFTPNGCDAFRRVDPRAWHLLWGEVHPNLIDDRFYRTAFAGDPLYLDSSPVKMHLLERFGQGEMVPWTELSGSELLCIAKLAGSRRE
jgi:SAM-dependent methyltransferase